MKRLNSILHLLLGVVVCVTTLSSCYTTKTGLHQEQVVVDDFPAFREQCIGQTHNQIVTSMGAPQRTEADGTGGSILIYENTTTTSVSNSIATAYNINYYKKTYTPGAQTTSQVSSHTDYVQFFVNSNNVCYEVKSNIPMKHTENRTVDGPYRKLHKGRTIWWWLGFPATLGVVIGVLTSVLGGGDY